MHGLVTLAKLNHQAAEADQILAKHEAADAANRLSSGHAEPKTSPYLEAVGKVLKNT